MALSGSHVHVAIIGSGFSGIGAAIRLKQAGFHDFVILERKADVGGCWRDNTYPGCACDVESHLYSFSFAPNPDWSRSFSPQPEIFAYLRGVAHSHGVLPHVRFACEFEQGVWDERAQRWQLTTSQGVFTADILIGGMGPLTEPSIPELPGLANFQGKTFHSARWDHDYPLADKRVAVLGTGASAIQFVPQIQPQVQKLSLFQRTPAWIIPRLDRAIGPRERALFRTLPQLQQLLRAAIFLRREAYVFGFRNPGVARLLERFAHDYLERSVPDPVLREKLRPSFRVGCKRILLSDDYLPALAQPNVDVVTSGIREVRAHDIVTSDGQVHPVDAIIFGTGFHVADIPFARNVVGTEGRSLHDVWQGSPKAHLGTMVSGFPNLFLLLGPNTGLGHTSVVLMIENQLRLVLGALEHMRQEQLHCLDVKPEVQAAYVRELEASSRDTVWTAGGCKSWYIDETGRNSTIWPSFTFAFGKRARFRPGEYVCSPARNHSDQPARAARNARNGSLTHVRNAG